MEFQATIHERGNGLAAVGDYVSGDDGELYEVVSVDSNIQVGAPGVGYKVDAIVRLMDWRDISDEQADDITCTAVIGEEVVCPPRHA